MAMKQLQQIRPTFRGLLLLIGLFLLGRVLLLIFGAYAYTQQDNVRAAVLHAHLLSARSSVIFVSIDRQDPSDSFIQRFKNAPVLVRKESQGIPRYHLPQPNPDPWDLYYIDTATRRKGAPIHIGSISWLGPFMARVKVGHPGFGERFTVVLTFRGWIVTKKEQTWIA